MAYAACLLALCLTAAAPVVGVDSMALNADASLLYMPVGEEEKSSQEWRLLDAASGDRAPATTPRDAQDAGDRLG